MIEVFTGDITQRGSAVGFGISETYPLALVGINGVLYGSGRSGGFYSIDTTTGIATVIATGRRYGALAVHEDTLYGLDELNDYLVSINLTTGAATRIGTVGAFDISETEPQGLVSFGGKLYMVGRSTRALLELDPITGIATQVGSAVNFGTGSQLQGFGLTVRNGTLLMCDNFGTIFRVDATTGLALPLVDVPTRTTDLEFFEGTLFITNSDRDALFSLDTALAPSAPIAMVVANANVVTFSCSEVPGATRYRYRIARGTPTGDGTIDNDRSVVQTVSFSSTYRIQWAAGTDDTWGEWSNIVSITTPAPVPSTTLGAASQISSIVAFGVNETGPGGLAANAENLFMVGQAQDALFSLNRMTGVATRIGSASRFGVNINYPHAIAFHNGVLYMVGEDANALFSIDLTTGVATRIGSAVNFGAPTKIVPRALVSHNGILYMNTGHLYSLDPTTGVATRIGSTQISESDASGMASYKGILYGVTEGTDILSVHSPHDGTKTRVGSVSQFGAGEQSARGLAAFMDTVYMVGDTLDQLLYFTPQSLGIVEQELALPSTVYARGRTAAGWNWQNRRDLPQLNAAFAPDGVGRHLERVRILNSGRTLQVRLAATAVDANVEGIDFSNAFETLGIFELSLPTGETFSFSFPELEDATEPYQGTFSSNAVRAAQLLAFYQAARNSNTATLTLRLPGT